MVDILGADGQPDIDAAARGYAIVLASGARLIGRLDELKMRLSPVYELHCNWQVQAENVIPMHAVMPLLMLATVEYVPIPADAVVIPFEGLGRHEKKHLLEAIANAAQLVKNMRAAQSGVVQASALPPLPPPAGRH